MKTHTDLYPKFRNKAGDLTAYAFACGYLQRAENALNSLTLWKEGCWHVRLVFNQNGGLDRVSKWETFDNLTDARKAFRKYKRDHQLKQKP